MRTIYVAEDGKQFDDEDECLNYEAAITRGNYCNQIIGIRCNNAIVPFTADDFIDASFFILVTTQDAINALRRVAARNGGSIYGIYKPGFYRWVDEDSAYELIDNLISGLEQQIIDLKNAQIIAETALSSGASPK